MSLSHDDVARIARLARIDIPAGETGEVLQQLNRVLGLVDELRAVDTTGVAPMAHPLDARGGMAQRLRPDEATESDRREAYQAVAPAVADGLYLVPRVLE